MQTFALTVFNDPNGAAIYQTCVSQIFWRVDRGTVLTIYVIVVCQDASHCVGVFTMITPSCCWWFGWKLSV